MPSGSRKSVIKNIVGLMLVPPAIFLFFRWFEHRQVYIPFRSLQSSGDILGHPWRDVYFEAADGTRLNGWFFEAKAGSGRPEQVFLLCHGNAGNISHRLDYYELFLSLGVNVFAFDYRGYGKSSGRPNEEGTYQDVRAAYDWLVEKGFAPNGIVVIGKSLGGGVAAELASRVPCAGLILQSTFTSVPDLGQELFPWLPVRWLGRIRYDTLSKLPGLRVPVLVMHSRSDRIIGFHHGQTNFAAAPDPSLFWELEGDHNDPLQTNAAKYRQGLEQFLALIEKEQSRQTHPAN